MSAAATLVGRRHELATVDDFLARAESMPCALFLEGAAGIGKTRLWKEGVELARRRGFRVLSTAPGGTDVRLGFAGLADLLADVAGETLPELPPPQRRALEVALLLAEPTGSGPDERAVAAAFLGSLRILAAVSPVLVAVDDAQWLDAASARMLEFASRRLDADRVGLLATVRVAREEPAPDELVRAFGGERVDRVPVGPLTVAGVYELVGAHLGVSLPRAVLLRVHATSGGNPFFALELVRALRRTGAEPEPGQPLPVPPNLRELVRSRLALLPPEAAETLCFAAALAQPTVVGLELAVGSPERVERDLATAADAGVVELRGESVRFTHPLLASIHLSTASTRARRGVHGRLASVALDPEERARHLALVAVAPDAGTAATLAEAGDRALSRGAIAAAAELAERACALTPPELRAEAHARLLVAAERHYAAGNTARAVRLLEDALAEAPPGPVRAELLWSVGKIKFEGEDTRVGLEFFRRALAETGADDGLRARILESLTVPAGKQEGFPAAERYAAEAAALAERVGDRATLARALAQLGSLRFSREGLDAQLFERAVALEEELGGLDLDYGPTARYAHALYGACDLDRARSLLERLCERGRATGDAAVNLPLFVLAELEFYAGNWERAARLAGEAYDVAVQTGREAAEPKGLFTLAIVEAGRGKVERARELAEQALVLTDGRGWSSGGPRMALGFLELSLENHAAAYEALLPAIERYRSLGTPFIHQCFDAVEALAGLGRVDDGYALLDRGGEAPGFMHTAHSVAADGRARGLLAAAAGELAAAEELLIDAVAAAERTGMPLEVGRSLVELGTVQRRLRKKHDARVTLERAVELLDALGARLWAERARRELGRIGGRSTPRATLSATETEIVELVAAGRSNSEVAQALHLTTKTVEWNLSKIYRRLGVRSRTELAASRRRE
jgi:DNA-binding CsgD family transcriptional regulator